MMYAAEFENHVKKHEKLRKLTNKLMRNMLDVGECELKMQDNWEKTFDLIKLQAKNPAKIPAPASSSSQPTSDNFESPRSVIMQPSPNSPLRRLFATSSTSASLVLRPDGGGVNTTKFDPKTAKTSENQNHEWATKKQMATQKRKISAVWMHFTKESKSRARCKLCHQMLKFCGNTTNLQNHLARKHVDVQVPTVGRKPRADAEECFEDEIDDPVNPTEVMFVNGTGLRQQTVQEAFHRPGSFKAGGDRFTAISNAVMFMLCRDGLPFNTVEKQGFRRLMKTVCPLYKVPCETKFTAMIRDKHEAMKHLLKTKLGIQRYVCLTTDIWTEMMNLRSYLGITCHFLEGNNINSCMLGVVPFEEAKTGANIAGLLNDIVTEQWGISEDMITVVITDHGSNIMNGVKRLFGEKKHLPCFAHTVNLVASKAIPLYKDSYCARMEPVIDEEEEITAEEFETANSHEYTLITIIKKLKLIVKFFKSSETAARRLREMQMADGRQESQCLALILDVRTRWNSLLKMIERFIVLANYVSNVLLSIPKSPVMLTGNDLALLREIMKVLRPLEKVTVEMSAESYCSLSKVIPLVRLLKLSYASMSLECEEAVSVRDKILVLIDRYFKHAERVEMLAVATLVDPRYKSIHFGSATAAANAIGATGKLLATEIQKTTRNVEEPESQTEAIGEESDCDDIWSIHDKHNLISSN
ncbi:E3 SUMO-protein ligase ZBED1-like [Armigeres subalbatus]|uniref:E3 SUMO-protein ligase ZBED1-like n=1 Tax=Armigeres subalbatus TaxID=124917 RepID=UPI002ED40CA2